MQFPVIVGSELIHDSDMPDMLMAALVRLLAPGGRAIIMQADARFRYGVEEFQSRLRSEPRFGVEIVPVPAEMVDRLSGTNSEDLHSEVMTYSLYSIVMH